MTLQQILRNIVRPINLLQQNFKYEIFVGVEHNDDLKVHVPNVKDPVEIRKICNNLLQAAHIVAMRHGLRMIFDDMKQVPPNDNNADAIRQLTEALKGMGKT